MELVEVVGALVGPDLREACECELAEILKALRSDQEALGRIERQLEVFHN